MQILIQTLIVARYVLQIFEHTPLSFPKDIHTIDDKTMNAMCLMIAKGDYLLTLLELRLQMTE